MGALQEAAKAKRFERYMEMMSTEPRTMQDLIEDGGWKYHTVRRDLTELLQRHKIVPHVKAGRNGKTAYVPSTGGYMPKVHVASSDSMLPISTLSDAYAATLRTGSNKTTEAAVGVLRIAADLLHKAYFMANGGEIKANHLLQLRKELNDYRKFLESTASVADQMIDNKGLWNPEELAKVVLDPDWDGERMESNYQEGESGD